MGEKAPRRWYPILIIVMCIRLILQANISFRAAPKAIHIAFSHFNVVKDQPLPSHKSISRWLTQIGLYKLNCQKEQANDWALIVDNSVQVGTQKCLVIIGTRLGNFAGKALTFEDMEMLIMELHGESNANIVCKALEKAQEKVGKAVMVCADDGPDLRRGVSLFCKKHDVGRVFDIIHKIGTFLKAILQNDYQWQTFSKLTAEAKKKMQQTKAAHLMPPNQRTKSRFLNIEILVHWGLDVMAALKNPAHPDKQLLEEYCGWVRNYEELIQRLRQFVLISQNVRRHIREHGICSTSGEQIDTMLETVTKFYGFNLEACEYAGKLIDFVHEQSQIVPTGEVWIGSSEIIESLFGKLKCLEQDQSKGGFTSLVLGAAACLGKVDVNVVRAAMDEVTSSDVDAWTRDQMGVTLLSKRRKALGSWRRKKTTKKKLPLYMGQESTGILQEKIMGF
jgi:hypothetical protein